jgi:hypothetical protein
MKGYEFTLHFKLTDENLTSDAVIEALAEAGCTDALVGTGVAGCIGLQFIREAKSAKDALTSAVNDVQKAIPTAKLTEAAPDMVGLSEVAEIVKVSRQNLRKLMLANALGFPSPLHAGSTTIWHLADVGDWLKSEKNYNIEPTVLEVTVVTKQINLAKSLREIQPQSAKLYSFF